MGFLAKLSTAITIPFGPVLDSAGAEYTGAVVADVKISKNNGTPGALNGSATLTHKEVGMYELVLTLNDISAVGNLVITLSKTTYVAPPITINVLPALVYDSLVGGTDNLQTDLLQVLGTTLTETSGGLIAAAIKKFFDVATPTGTVNSLPDAVPGAANGLVIAGTNAAITFTQVIVNNPSGVAVDIDGTTGGVTINSTDGDALLVSYDGAGGYSALSLNATSGTGNALKANGGNAGNGVWISGVYGIYSQGSTDGMRLVSTGSGYGLTAKCNTILGNAINLVQASGVGSLVGSLSLTQVVVNNPSGVAVDIDGTTGGMTINASNGIAASFISTGGNGEGISATGNGSGNGIRGVGGATGAGLLLSGNYGLYVTGSTIGGYVYGPDYGLSIKGSVAGEAIQLLKGVATGAIVGNITGDVSGKILGGGSGTITATGVWALDNAGAAIATATNLATVAGYLDTEITDIRTVTERLSAMLVQDGAVYQFTANALELAPTSGGLDAAGVRAAIGMDAADLDSQLAAILAAASPTGGSFTQTVTVRTVGGVAIPNANVNLYSGTTLVDTKTTNASGVASPTCNAGSYTLKVTCSGYASYSGALAVTADASVSITLTAISITASSPGLTTGYLFAYDEDGTIEEGVSFSLQMTGVASSEGYAYDGAPRTAVSDSNGLVEFTNMFKGGTYSIRRGTRGKSYSVAIATNEEDTFPIPSVIGRA